MTSLALIPLSTLKKVIEIRGQIESLEAELASLGGGSANAAAGTVKAAKAPKPEGSRKMSAKGRARIAAAQRKRWAAHKAAAVASGTAKPAAVDKPAGKKRKGGISAAGRARIAAAQKARWAAVRKQAKSA